VTEATVVKTVIAEAHRREWALVLAATVRVARDLDLAEERVQEAYASALQTWVRPASRPTRPPGSPPRSGARSTRYDGMRVCVPGCRCWWSPGKL